MHYSAITTIDVGPSHAMCHVLITSRPMRSPKFVWSFRVAACLARSNWSARDPSAGRCSDEAYHFPVIDHALDDELGRRKICDSVTKRSVERVERSLHLPPMYDHELVLQERILQ